MPIVFLNPTREGAPDIDTDVGDRDLLINMMKDKWGDENIVPISNYNTFKLKSLVKDISRFYGIPFGEVNKALAPVEDDVKRAVFKQGTTATLAGKPRLSGDCLETTILTLPGNGRNFDGIDS